MELCAIICSPRINGNTSFLVKEVISSASQQGARTNIFYVSGKKLLPCDGCRSCWENNKCRLDDYMQLIHSAMLTADGIIIGSPVYFWSVSAQAKIVIDRSYAFYSKKLLKNKAIGFVTVAARRGNTNAISTLTSFAILQQMHFIDCVTAYASQKKDLIKDTNVISEARSLGKKIANIS